METTERVENQRRIIEKIKNKIRENLLAEAKTDAAKKKMFFVSDLHFDDERLNLYGRDILFKNAKEANEFIVERWNEVVLNNSDVVYVIGDVSMTLSGLENMEKCRGKKILIRGNYDININDGGGKGTAKCEINDKVLSKYFDKIYDELELEIGGEKCYLNHYPVNAKEDMFNVCGHIHSLFLVQRNMVNVSADANLFTPLSEERIIFLRNAIRSHYDANVFAGELLANIEHRKGEVKILRAPEYDNVPTFDGHEDIVCFMAGPIDGTNSEKMWQEELMKKIEKKLEGIKINKNIVLCSPRRLEKPKNFIYEEQVNWESYYLKKSAKQGVVVFWLAKEDKKIEGRTFARTTRFELGEWWSEGQNIKNFKIVIGAQSGFDGTKYIEKKFKDLDKNFNLLSNLDDMAEEIVKQIKNKINETN